MRPGWYSSCFRRSAVRYLMQSMHAARRKQCDFSCPFDSAASGRFKKLYGSRSRLVEWIGDGVRTTQLTIGELVGRPWRRLGRAPAEI